MNLYEIEYSRENGTKDITRIISVSEEQARRDFRRSSYYNAAVINNIVLINTNATATKQQEREALSKIQKIVEQLGADSYLAAALEGCFEIAASNIENDEYCSLVAMARCSEEAYEELQQTMKKYAAITRAYATEITALKAKLYDFMVADIRESESRKDEN